MVRDLRIIYIAGIVGVLLFSMWISLFHLDHNSLWYDEGFTAYVVYDSGDMPDGIRATIGYIIDSLTGVSERTRDDVHPILYYLLVDMWTLIMGEAVWILRLPSVFFGVMGVATTYALGRSLFDRPTGFIGALLLGMTHFFIYYNREARMYTLLLLIALLFIWATVRWLRKPSIGRGVWMGLWMGLLLHTHYLGIFIMIGLGLYQVYYILRERQFMGVVHWLIPYVTGFIVFLPWLPFAIRQLTGHPDGPLGQTQKMMEWGTITWLWDIVTSSHGALFFIGFIVGGGIILLRQTRFQHALILLIIWFFITPIGLIAIEMSGRSVMVARYILMSLPALVLFSAFGLRHLTTTPSLLGRFRLETAGLIVSAFLITWIIVTQLTTYNIYWAEKPRWAEALAQLADTRQPDEPAIVHLPPHNVATYYARQYDYLAGISIDIGWTDFMPEQLHDFVNRLDNAEAVWAILPMDSPESWYVIHALADKRHIGYRDSVQNMIFYRFDRDDSTDGSFDFGFYQDGQGTILHDAGGIGHHYYVNTGQDLCVPVRLDAVQTLTDSYQLHLTLTQGYNTLRAESTLALPTFNAGDTFSDDVCIPIPADAPRGPYLLRVALKHNNVYLPVVESNDALMWGYYLGVAWVSVDTPSSS